MTDEKAVNEREKIVQAISIQEKLRGTIDGSIIEATLGALYKRLDELEAVSLIEQRKQITVLFMDVVGSTEMIHDLDPEENLTVMDTAMRRLSEPVKHYHGRVTRYMGDGFKAVFGLPQAQENDPEMAVRAGLEMLAAAKDYSVLVNEEWSINGFSIRVGIHTGLVVTGGQTEGADTIVGSTVNLTSRLESAATPDSVLISQITKVLKPQAQTN